jgi:antitoxin (DNA-binding transcriptional repressor) of toxin-antitoxin stability system
MKTVDKTQLKDNLLELLQSVELQGEEILLTEGNKPVARISPYEKSYSTAELFKIMRGKVRYFEDLTTPTTEDLKLQKALKEEKMEKSEKGF